MKIKLEEAELEAEIELLDKLIEDQREQIDYLNQDMKELDKDIHNINK